MAYTVSEWETFLSSLPYPQLNFLLQQQRLDKYRANGVKLKTLSSTGKKSALCDKKAEGNSFLELGTVQFILIFKSIFVSITFY